MQKNQPKTFHSTWVNPAQNSVNLASSLSSSSSNIQKGAHSWINPSQTLKPTSHPSEQKISSSPPISLRSNLQKKNSWSINSQNSSNNNNNFSHSNNNNNNGATLAQSNPNNNNANHPTFHNKYSWSAGNRNGNNNNPRTPNNHNINIQTNDTNRTPKEQNTWSQNNHNYHNQVSSYNPLQKKNSWSINSQNSQGSTHSKQNSWVNSNDLGNHKVATNLKLSSQSSQSTIEKELLSQISFYAGLINKQKSKTAASFKKSQRSESLQRKKSNFFSKKRNLSWKQEDHSSTKKDFPSNLLKEKRKFSWTNNHIKQEKQKVSLKSSYSLKKSIRTLQAKKRKTEYCLFYCKYGKCNSRETCKFIHDPAKVAVCRKFLKGCCHDDACLLSHKISSEKLPNCAFFLKGKCTKENCPYPHVYVNRNAEVCENFLKKGHCPDGDKCKKLHTFKKRKKEDEAVSAKKEKEKEGLSEDEDIEGLEPSFL